jgi:hypothetical protein
MILILAMVLACYAIAAIKIIAAHFMRAERRKNRDVTSANPARPNLLAARNAPGARATLLTVNPKSILN